MKKLMQGPFLVARNAMLSFLAELAYFFLTHRSTQMSYVFTIHIISTGVFRGFNHSVYILCLYLFCYVNKIINARDKPYKDKGQCY
jgi:hypothetical protein